MSAALKLERIGDQKTSALQILVNDDYDGVRVYTNGLPPDTDLRNFDQYGDQKNGFYIDGCSMTITDEALIFSVGTRESRQAVTVPNEENGRFFNRDNGIHIEMLNETTIFLLVGTVYPRTANRTNSS